jgi:hypothetical protein
MISLKSKTKLLKSVEKYINTFTRKKLVYDMKKPYKPSITKETVKKHTNNLIKNVDCKYLNCIYKYTVDPKLSQENVKKVVELIKDNSMYLSKDKERVILYKFKNLDHKGFSGNKESLHIISGQSIYNLGTIVRISKNRIFSLTFSNNYPLLTTFSDEMMKYSDPKWKDNVDTNYDFTNYIDTIEVSEFYKKFIEFLKDKFSYSEIKENIIELYKDNEFDTIRDLLVKYKKEYESSIRMCVEKFLEYEKQKEINEYESKILCCVYVFLTKKGLIIKDFSIYPEQDEVILTDNSKFMVVDIFNSTVRQLRGRLNEENTFEEKEIPGLCIDEKDEKIKVFKLKNEYSSDIYEKKVKFVIFNEI